MDATPESDLASTEFDGEEELADLGEGSGARSEPEPYKFDPTDVDRAKVILDDAFADTLDGYFAARAVTQAAAAHGIDANGSLVRELVLAASYPLHLERQGRAGCGLGPSHGEGPSAWPPEIGSVPEPAVELWRGVAGSVTAPAAIARFEDLLFCRRDGNGRDRAVRAANAYLDAAARRDLDFDGVEALIRAWTLARSVGAADLEAEIRGHLASLVSSLLDDTPGEQPGFVLPMLAAVATPVRGDARSAVADPIDVGRLLERAAQVFSRGDLASEIAGYRRGRTRDDAALEAINRDEVEGYLREAEAATVPAVRMHHLEAAARVARARGLADLVRFATAEMQRIQPSQLGLQRITAEGSLPRFIPESWLRQFTRSPDWRDAMEWFCIGDPPTGDIERLRDHERNTRGGLRRLFPTTVLGRDGLPRATTVSEADQVAREMSFAARIGAEHLGGLMAEGLHRVSDHYGTPSEDDLVAFFTAMGCCDEGLARSLARSFGHFWKGEFESCLHVAAPKVEAAARNLLRELDEGVYRVQAGNDPGGYPGLYVLLDELEKLALDESWAYFLRWLLLGPFGVNIRNDLAHGFVFDVSPTYAALTLRALTLLGIVAGPAPGQPLDLRPTDDEEGPSTRDRLDVLRLLEEPLPQGGPLDAAAGWLARQVERAWWTLQTSRARARLRRSRRKQS